MYNYSVCIIVTIQSSTITTKIFLQGKENMNPKIIIHSAIVVTPQTNGGLT